MKKLVLFNFMLLLTWAGQVCASDTHEFSLKNGMKLVVKEDHRAPVVVSQVWYKVGSSYEHDGITGVSHALEHMMFKGTSKHGPGEFSRIISENGGSENAFTGADFTAYFQTLEKSRLPISFELEADRMRNLTLPEDEFKKEIEVVKEERRWRTDDDPGSYTYEVLKATAFQTSPYRQPTIGWMSDLQSMNVSDLRKWYEKWYAPNNAVVVVTGDVNPDEVYRLAEKYFGSLPAGESTEIKNRPEVQQVGIKRAVVKRPAELPEILMAYKTPALKTAIENPELVPEWEPYALEVLSSILDGGNSARFTSRLVRGGEIVTSIDLGYSMISRLDDLLTISAVPGKGHSIEDVEHAIREEIEQLKTALVSQEELDRVKTQVVTNEIYQRDSIFYQSMIIGMLESIGMSWRYIDEYVDRIQAITPEQIQAVAQKYLIDDGLTVVRLDPLPLDKPAGRQSMGGGAHVR